MCLGLTGPQNLLIQEDLDRTGPGKGQAGVLGVVGRLQGGRGTWNELVSSVSMAGLSAPSPLPQAWGPGQGPVGQVSEMGLGVFPALSSKVKYLP